VSRDPSQTHPSVNRKRGTDRDYPIGSAAARFKAKAWRTMASNKRGKHDGKAHARRQCWCMMASNNGGRDGALTIHDGTKLVPMASSQRTMVRRDKSIHRKSMSVEDSSVGISHPINRHISSQCRCLQLPRYSRSPRPEILRNQPR
jgi:hypothetical protein